MNKLYFIYYSNIIYPFRFLMKYGNIERVKTIVPLISTFFIYIFLFVFIKLAHIKLNDDFQFVLYVFLILILYGFFEIKIFSDEKIGIKKLLNDPNVTSNSCLKVYTIMILPTLLLLLIELLKL